MYENYQILNGLDPEYVQKRRESFLSKVIKDSSGCWLWPAVTNSKGYCIVKINGGVITIHRLSYELFNGPIPAGLCVCHRCDVRRCGNPDHLFVATVAENNQDRARKGRSRHIYFLENRRPYQRLTAEKVKLIREMYANGYTQVVIGKRFDIADTYVSRIVNRHVWDKV